MRLGVRDKGRDLLPKIWVVLDVVHDYEAGIGFSDVCGRREKIKGGRGTHVKRRGWGIWVLYFFNEREKIWDDWIVFCGVVILFSIQFLASSLFYLICICFQK